MQMIPNISSFDFLIFPAFLYFVDWALSLGIKYDALKSAANQLSAVWKSAEINGPGASADKKTRSCPRESTNINSALSGWMLRFTQRSPWTSAEISSTLS